MADHITALLRFWPPQLLRHVQLYVGNSMAFFWEMIQHRTSPGLVFVDGNHDYEYAAFDIASAARCIAPGGFIFVDNIAQPGPFFAARDFLIANPAWRELGSSAMGYNREKAFDRHRTTIFNTDFFILRAPLTRQVRERPANFGVIVRIPNKINGLRVKFAPPAAPGTLHVQAVLRGFGQKLEETVGEASLLIEPGMEMADATFNPAVELEKNQFVSFTVEPWLIWHGQAPLMLRGDPEPF
jgi:hypothetical protein